MKEFKKQTFSNGSVKDPYTGLTLEQGKSVEVMKEKYGKDNWSDHLAESDHKHPLKRIYNDNKNNPWVSNDDIKTIANSDDNLEIVSKKFNSTKGERTNEEFLTDNERLAKNGLNISDEAKKRGIKSGKEAKRNIDKKIRQSAIKNVLETGHNAGVDAAKESTKCALPVSIISNAVSVMNGEKNADEAIKDIAHSTGESALKSYVMGGSSTVISHTLASSKYKFLQLLAENNVPEKVITAVMMTGNTIGRWLNGEINTQELIIDLGESGLSYLTTSYSAIVGQALIPIPIIGATVGVFIGSILSSKYYNDLIESLKQKNLEHEERLRIIAESNAIAQMYRSYREKLENYLEIYFSDYQHYFDEALNTIQIAFYSEDANSVITGANQITKKLGGTIQYETVDEFETFLFDDSTDVI